MFNTVFVTSQMLNALHWYERFVWLCEQPVNSQVKDEFGPSLCLHWQWLHEHLITLLRDRCVVDAFGLSVSI